MQIQIEVIIDKVEKFYYLEAGSLAGYSRSKTTSHARAVATYICRLLTNLSYIEISKHFKKHYTSVISSVAKIKQEYLTNKKLEAIIDLIVDDLRGKPAPQQQISFNNSWVAI